MSTTRFTRVATAVAAVVLAGCATTGDATTTTTETPTTTTTSSVVPSTITTTSTTTTTAAATDDFEVGRKALLTLAGSVGDSVPMAGLAFADTVSMGLHNQLTIERSIEELADDTGWIIDALEYAGYSGPFAVLDALRDGGPLVIDQGPHPHCAGPPLDPPEGFESATRVHAQPKDIDSCIAWFSVDLWIVAGEIQAVTFELFGP